ncbi:MAG: hypothetical protein DRH08_01020 [Deltaproteobacteria bacterium]|nr:MAG: hypothetical protein DRH08_01020 [Deltaproteobacteria bacterium]
MANLNRYSVRLQVKRDILLDAQNTNHSKDLAELDVEQMEDSEKIQAQSSSLIQENTGTSANGSVTLNRYEVKVRFRRNIVLDAVDLADARHWAEQDQEMWDDSEEGTIQIQQITFMQQNTGTT